MEDDGAAAGAGRVGSPRELSPRRPQILMTTGKPPGDPKPGRSESMWLHLNLELTLNFWSNLGLGMRALGVRGRGGNRKIPRNPR